ncbi:hypothetical protein FS749_002317 [Ceratobasidium sp. UAMH 11750]|nr:hypothetical protein FS749_002317 [Ceratobasidium sp. UAMH 11750]
MLCVLDNTIWAQIEHQFGRLRDSPVICCMANGACVPSLGTGTGLVSYKHLSWLIRFEVIDSKGAFELLLGKDWLRRTGATQVFPTDSIEFNSPDGAITIENENPKKRRPDKKPVGPRPQPQPAERAVEVQEESQQASRPGEPILCRSWRLRGEKEPEDDANPFWVTEAALERMDFELDREDGGSETELLENPESLWGQAKAEAEEEAIRGVLLTEPVVEQAKQNTLAEILERARRKIRRDEGPIDIAALVDHNEQAPNPQQYKPPVPDSDRTTDPFKPERVAEILRKVRIGDSLSQEQKTKVENLLGEYADIFALNLSEVLPVDIKQMRLNVPEGATFPKRAGQRKLTKPQRQALYTTLDELEAARIIEQVSQDQVAAVSPLNVVPKPGGTERPSLATLQRMANTECRKYGIPVQYLEAGFCEETDAKVSRPVLIRGSRLKEWSFWSYAASARS